MVAYIFPPSPSTVRGKQLVVNLPLPSAQAYLEKTKETAKEKPPPPANYSSSASAMCQDPALTTPCCSTGNVDWTLRGVARPHTSGALALPAYSHAARCSRGIVAVFSHTFAWARCSRGIRHARRGLVAVFSHAFAWARCSRGIRHARRGLVAIFSHAFAWARCSRGIRHARRDLVAVFSHAFAWARCSRGVWWSQRWSWVER